MENFTILLVDDIPANIFSLRLLIEDRFDDVTIIEAANVKEAIIEIMKYKVDLVLTDIQMPEASGFELVEYLKDVQETKNIPLMVITGIYEDHLYKKKAFNSSKDIINFFTKPIDDEMFILKLEFFMKNYKRKKEKMIKVEGREKELQEKQKILSMLDSVDNHFNNNIKITKEEIEVFLPSENKDYSYNARV